MSASKEHANLLIHKADAEQIKQSDDFHCTQTGSLRICQKKARPCLLCAAPHAPHDSHESSKISHFSTIAGPEGGWDRKSLVTEYSCYGKRSQAPHGRPTVMS